MATQPISERLLAVPVPQLPAAPEQYSRMTQAQFNDTLRLFFNQLTAQGNNLVAPLGGRFLGLPYIEVLMLTSQTAAVINTAYRIAFATTGVSSGGRLVAGDGVHVDHSGVYNYQFSIQFINTDTAIHDAVVWLRKGSGTGAASDVANSSRVVSVPNSHGGTDGRAVLSANFYVEMLAGDYVELWWATNSTSISVATIPAGSLAVAVPASPAAVATVSFVSALPR